MLRNKALRNVRLLVKEGDRIVWRTFEANWLVGTASTDGRAVLGTVADDEDRWGSDHWCVLEGIGGKFAVYRYDWRETGGVLEVFESLSAMRGRIPDSILDGAERAAGIRAYPDDVYPVEPLDL